MSNKVDLNSDLGESFGNYIIGNDEQIIPLVSSVNIACGFHAADPVVITKTILRAKKAQVAVGAHPGFPDLMGFGRRNMNVTAEEAKAYVQYQVAAVMGMAKAKGLTLQHVKPHGALYNMAVTDYNLSLAICEGIKEIDENLIVLGLSGSEIIRAAKNLGMKVAGEVFADRGYEKDGTLVNRKKDGAFIHDETEAVARVVRMVKEGKVTAVTGEDIDIQANSICVHGDGEKALLFVESIRAGLIAAGIEIAPLKEIVV